MEKTHRKNESVMEAFHRRMSMLVALFSLFMFMGQSAMADPAQNFTVKGKVSYKKNNETIPSANVIIKGTTVGVMTDMDGNYTIEVPDNNAVLQFSFMGCTTLEIPVNGRSAINANLEEDATTLDEVVVTAMGIEKRTKGLTYSTQKISSSEITTIKDPSMMNTLSGKISGVQITKNTSLGGSSKVSIRGNRSLQGNNQPLYVVDGIPISNASAAQGSEGYGGSRDAGDGISNLNPDDIESMNVLKGAAAAALYGSQASNGVIVITTKKGREGRTQVDFSSNYTADIPIHMLKFQNNYARTNATADYSWANERTNFSDNHVKEYFRTGNTFVNAVSMTSGTEKVQTFFSYSNTSATGNTHVNKLSRNTFNVRATSKFFNDRLSIDGRLNYMTQKVNDRPQAGYYMNALPGLYLYPRGSWTSDLRDNYSYFDASRNMEWQNWDFQNDDTRQNPYWVDNKLKSEDRRDRYIASISARLDITDYLNVQGRISMDKTADEWERKIHAGTSNKWAPEDRGRYSYYNGKDNQQYADFMVNFNKGFGNFNVIAMAGTSITDYRYRRVNMDTDKNGLYLPNIFTLTNMGKGGSLRERTDEHRQLQSVFGTAQIGYNDYLFFDVTVRNDWSSTVNQSYFYPSVGLTAVISDMIQMPEAINLIKFRGSFTQVGNDLPIYITNPQDKLTTDGIVLPNKKKPFREMKPEKSNSWEFGMDLAFFKNTITFDGTFYKTNTKNQYFEMSTSQGTGWEAYYVNAGNIQNTGVEIMLGVNPFVGTAIGWRSAVNFSLNRNKIIELAPGIDRFEMGKAGKLRVLAIEGGQWGEIYGQTIKRDGNGNMYVKPDGTPVVTSGDVDKFNRLGNINPDFLLGWSNTISWKDLSFNFLLDAKVGGKVISSTQSLMDQFGVSKATGDARDNGINVSAIVEETGSAYTEKINVEKYYKAISGSDGALGEYIYSATNVRMREMSLTYKLPVSKFIGSDKFIKKASLSVVARNLFFIYKKDKDLPFDPDYALGNTNKSQNMDFFGMPSTRSVGFTLNVSF